MGAPSNSKCGQAEHGMSDGNMESSWAQNNSHLSKLMWRPEVSLLACKISRALDSASLGPAKPHHRDTNSSAAFLCTGGQLRF